MPAVPVEMTGIELAVLRCPSCAGELARVTANSFHTCQTGSFLDDGDSLARQPQSSDDCSLFASLLLGCCKACSTHYYVVEACVMRAEEDVNFEYVTGEREASISLFSVATRAKSAGGVDTGHLPWLVERQITSDGPRQVHLFGPFRLARVADVRGEHGVSPCQGRGATPPWTHGAQLVSELTPHLYELARHEAATG